MAERRSKYGAVQTIGDDGHPYDSRLEADVARVLDLLVQQRRIRYDRQVRYELAPKRPERGQRAVNYTADFVVYPADLYPRALRGDPSGATVVEVKGFRTRLGQLKLRWFREVYPEVPLFEVHSPQEVIGVIEMTEKKYE